MTDKEKIRAEIERQISTIDRCPKITDTQIIVLEGNKVVLSKLLSFIDSMQEEPISDGRDIFDNCLKSEEKFILPQKISGNINCENCLYSSACALGDIQACIIDKPVNEDLEEAATEICSKVLKGETITIDGYEYVVISDVEECFKAGAHWQKQKDAEYLIAHAECINKAYRKGIDFGIVKMKQKLI